MTDVIQEDMFKQIEKYINVKGFDKTCEEAQKKVIKSKSAPIIYRFSKIKGANLNKLTKAMILTKDSKYMSDYIIDILINKENQTENIYRTVSAFYNLDNYDATDILKLSSILYLDKEKLAGILLSDKTHNKNNDICVEFGNRVNSKEIENIIYKAISMPNVDINEVREILKGFMKNKENGHFDYLEMTKNIIDRCKKDKDLEKLMVLAKVLQPTLRLKAIYAHNLKDNYYGKYENKCMSEITKAIAESGKIELIYKYAYNINYTNPASNKENISMNIEQYKETIKVLGNAILDNANMKQIETFRYMNEYTQHIMDNLLKEDKRNPSQIVKILLRK